MQKNSTMRSRGLTGIAIVAIVCGLWVALQGNVSAAVACLSAGILILLVADIQEFELVKGFGFEARARKLDAKIEEADALVNRMTTMSRIVSDVSFQLMARLGRWDGSLPKRDLLDLSTRLQELLAECGESTQSIDDSMMPLHRMQITDLSMPIYNAINEAVRLDNERISEQQKERIKVALETTGQSIPPNDDESAKLQAEWEANQKFSKSFGEEFRQADTFELPDFLDNAVGDMPNLDYAGKQALKSKIAPLMTDLKYYRRHKKLKDPENWLKRGYGE